MKPELGGRFVLAACLSALAACHKPAPKPAPLPIVTISAPMQKRVVDWDDYVGHFEAVDQVDVRPRVSGYLQSVGFSDGGMVKKGQVLFVIDPRPYQATLDQAKAQAARAQATLQNAGTALARGKTLLEARAISQEELDNRQAAERQAAADLDAAQANVRAAALNLEFTKVVAPMSGRISDRRVAPGNLVTADATILTSIVNLDPIRFAFEGSEGLYLKYQRQNSDGSRNSSRVKPNPVLIRLQDEGDYRWKGRMEFVDNSLNTGAGTIRGRALVDNPKAFLTPGMFGHMRLLGSGAYDALLVPDQSIAQDQANQIVYVVGGGVVGQRVVQTGPLIDGLRVVRTGLTPSDQVVIDGVQRAHPGQKVDARPGTIKLMPIKASDDGLAYVAPPSASATAAADGGR
jgi:RND family efflux transporter MFP subunit